MATKAPRIPLPDDRPSHVKSGILHVISLAQVALTVARARARKRGVVARLRGKVEEQAGEIFRLREELSSIGLLSTDRIKHSMGGRRRRSTLACP